MEDGRKKQEKKKKMGKIKINEWEEGALEEMLEHFETEKAAVQFLRTNARGQDPSVPILGEKILTRNTEYGKVSFFKNGSNYLYESERTKKFDEQMKKLKRAREEENRKIRWTKTKEELEEEFSKDWERHLER